MSEVEVPRTSLLSPQKNLKILSGIDIATFTNGVAK
jgi:hypothetical protein